MVIKITPQQAKRVNALLRKLCANYNGGNCLLLDRLSLSEKNDWKDEHGRVYQYFTIHQAQELLHFGHEKVCRLFAEQDAADLIERRRQGQGKANRIYLKEFTRKYDYRNSRSPGIGRK